MPFICANEDCFTRIDHLHANCEYCLPCQEAIRRERRRAGWRKRYYGDPTYRETRIKQARARPEKCAEYSAASRAKRRATPLGLRKFLLWSARARAKKRGLAFSITLDDIIIPEVCPYLGIPLFAESNKRGISCVHTPSLDRTDNALGYIPGNVEVISNRANLLKRDASLSEMLALATAYLDRV